jgi:hypothetical protein
METNYEIEQIGGAEKEIYRIETAAGSIFNCEFKPTLRVVECESSSEYGDVFLEGWAVSVGRQIRFVGIAATPEVGGLVTVSDYRPVDGQDDMERDSELITNVRRLR